MHDAGEPDARPESGFCIRCAADEVGEAIGRISRRHRLGRRRLRGLYQRRGHARERSCATCSRRGDAWYRTGDLMRRDESGFFYFVDRIGDTFRWKGENVATVGGRRSDHGLSRRRGGERLWRTRSRQRGPRRHGGRRRRRGTSIWRAFRAHLDAPAARLRPSAVPAHRDGIGDGYLQAPEERSRARWL